MTMSTDGRQIEELPEEEKRRELRLRYSGAISVLCDQELKVVAARLIATYPLTTEQQFVEMARQAFVHVVSEVALHARDARGAATSGG